jgi:hypothetical protein
MSVQLIVYPQDFNGLNPLNGTGPECVVDGWNFTTLNGSASTLNYSGGLLQYVQGYIIFSGGFIANTWYRVSHDSTPVTTGTGAYYGKVTFTGGGALNDGNGMVQRLTNLTVGATYQMTISFYLLNATALNFYHFTSINQNSVTSITGISTQTFTFVAQTANDDIIGFYGLGASVVDTISVKRAPTATTNLNNGQEILDLYEDEDIPLTLSVDEFKNVAEQVKSYSKAFQLPATKNNNRIFDNLFEITRSSEGDKFFNPYVKTQCILKQDGFTIFEGYLRVIDISDKEGEISYNVNLYSEVIALAEVLGEKTFSELDFSELDHEYTKTNIRNSWHDSPAVGIAYTNPSTSGFRNDNDTLKYPFCDWTGNWQIAYNPSSSSGANHNMPKLKRLEQAFRPFLQIKYLIDRIFTQANFPFSYTSNFFETSDFKKLYMDFNWGDAITPMIFNSTGGLTLISDFNLTGSFQTVSFNELDAIPNYANPGSDLDSEFGYSSGVFTAVTDNQTYTIDASMFFNALVGAYHCEWVHTDSAGTETIYGQQITGTFSAPNYYTANFSVMLQTGETLLFRAKETAGNVHIVTAGSTSGVPPVWNFSTLVNVTTNAFDTTSDSLLQTLRGETEQWQFLKGIMTMFNLVSMPDPLNPNNILIETYNDMFLENADSSELFWSDKVDIEDIKLTPLTELNKNTIFKFVEDDDDYAFNVYKNATQGHLYGSLIWDAQTSGGGLPTVLSGEEEIIPEPFAATVVKPLATQFSEMIVPAIYAHNADDGVSEAFDNSPRIMYNLGEKTLLNMSYYIPSQNGVTSNNEENYLQFAHLSEIPTTLSTLDFHFGECQLIGGVGNPVANNLFRTYWQPYYNELYNPDTRIMTLKVDLRAGDINTFKFYDTVQIKNRKFRVNKIDYKPNDLSTVEFILIP